MPLHFIAESQSAFLTSTPVLASQDSFVNSPVDCKVPTTPSITCVKYVSDQIVPLTPVAQVVYLSPANSLSVPRTPENSIKKTPAIIDATICVDNPNVNSQDDASTIDQIVPFTPEGNFMETSRQGNHYQQSAYSHHFTVLHKNIGSCIDDPYLHENRMNAAKYPRSTPKRLLLTSCENNFDDSAHQNLTDIWISQTGMSNVHENETLTLSISEYLSQASNDISKALPERLISPPLYLNLPPQSGTEPLKPSLTSSSTSLMLPSVSVTSNSRTEASTSMIYLSATRDDITQMRRPFSWIKESHCFQGRDKNDLFPVSEQLKLFDGDDIFA